jgi:hypothetical protein
MPVFLASAATIAALLYAFKGGSAPTAAQAVPQAVYPQAAAQVAAPTQDSSGNLQALLNDVASPIIGNPNPTVPAAAAAAPQAAPATAMAWNQVAPASPFNPTGAPDPYIAAGLMPSYSYPVSSLSSALNPATMTGLGYVQRTVSGVPTWVGPNVSTSPVPNT